MNKKNLIIFILIVTISFGCGYFTAISRSKNNREQSINVFGTYTQDFSTISINHDLTYQYSYPFTSGQLLKIDEQIYKLQNGNLDGYVALFYDDALKLIDIKENIIWKRFAKIMATESVLKDDN